MGDLDIGDIQTAITKSSEIGGTTHLANNGNKIELKKFYYSWRFGDHYKEFGDKIVYMEFMANSRLAISNYTGNLFSWRPINSLIILLQVLGVPWVR